MEEGAWKKVTAHVPPKRPSDSTHLADVHEHLALELADGDALGLAQRNVLVAVVVLVHLGRVRRVVRGRLRRGGRAGFLLSANARKCEAI